MANVDAVFLDTNILVYANLALSPFHHQAQQQLQLLEEQGYQLWISRQVLKEYLSAMTRRGELTGEIPISSLAQDIRYFAQCFQLAEEDANVTERLLLLIEQVTVGGRQIHDANIVATMLVYNIPQLLTHNTGDFNRFGELITVLPLETQT